MDVVSIFSQVLRAQSISLNDCLVLLAFSQFHGEIIECEYGTRSVRTCACVWEDAVAHQSRVTFQPNLNLFAKGSSVFFWTCEKHCHKILNWCWGFFVIKAGAAHGASSA